MPPVGDPTKNLISFVEQTAFSCLVLVLLLLLFIGVVVVAAAAASVRNITKALVFAEWLFFILILILILFLLLPVFSFWFLVGPVASIAVAVDVGITGAGDVAAILQPLSFPSIFPGPRHYD